MCARPHAEANFMVLGKELFTKSGSTAFMKATSCSPITWWAFRFGWNWHLHAQAHGRLNLHAVLPTKTNSKFLCGITFVFWSNSTKPSSFFTGVCHSNMQGSEDQLLSWSAPCPTRPRREVLRLTSSAMIDCNQRKSVLSTSFPKLPLERLTRWRHPGRQH